MGAPFWEIYKILMSIYLIILQFCSLLPFAIHIIIGARKAVQGPGGEEERIRRLQPLNVEVKERYV